MNKGAGWTIEQGAIEATEAAGRLGPAPEYWTSLLRQAWNAALDRAAAACPRDAETIYALRK